MLGGGEAVMRARHSTRILTRRRRPRGFLHPVGSRRGRASSLLVRNLRGVRDSQLGQPVEVLLPLGRACLAQFVQVSPGVEAGIVAIVEHQLHGVVADRLARAAPAPAACPVAAFPGRGRGPALRPTANTRAGIRTTIRRLAVVEGHLEHARLLAQLDIGGRTRCPSGLSGAAALTGCTAPGLRPVRACRGSRRRRGHRSRAGARSGRRRRS